MLQTIRKALTKHSFATYCSYVHEAIIGTSHTTNLAGLVHGCPLVQKVAHDVHRLQRLLEVEAGEALLWQEERKYIINTARIQWNLSVVDTLGT